VARLLLVLVGLLTFRELMLLLLLLLAPPPAHLVPEQGSMLK
jgi:hypothetical protein